MKNKTFSLYLATILFRIVQHYIDGVFISSLSGKLAHFPRALGHILCSSGEEPAAAATSDPEVELARKWEKSSQRTTQKSSRDNKKRFSKGTLRSVHFLQQREPPLIWRHRSVARTVQLMKNY